MSSIEETESATISTLIMLKDKYRPVINLSRDNVEELNLEAACALGILEECVPRRVYMSGLTCHENYHYIPQKNYWQHIADHPEWEELLRFNTEEGKMQEVLQEYANAMAADSEITTPEEPTLPSGWDSSKSEAKRS